MSWSRCLIAALCLWLALPARAFADDDRDADPAPEALPGALDHDDEDAAEEDAPEQGAFVLPSPIRLDSARKPVLVDVFPSYAPRNPITAWGRGWDAPALSIRRVRPGGPPRFDAGDSFASAWGSLQLAIPSTSTAPSRRRPSTIRAGAATTTATPAIRPRAPAVPTAGSAPAARTSAAATRSR